MPGFIPGAPSGGSGGDSGSSDSGSDDDTIAGPSGGLAPSGDDRGTLERTDDDDDDDSTQRRRPTRRSGGNIPGAPSQDSSDGGSSDDTDSGSSGSSNGLESGSDPFGGGQMDSNEQSRLEARQESVSRIPGAPGSGSFAQTRDTQSDIQARRQRAAEQSVERIPGSPDSDTFAQERDDDNVGRFDPTIDLTSGESRANIPGLTPEGRRRANRAGQNFTVGEQASNVASNFFAATPAGQLADTEFGQSVSRGVSGVFSAGRDVRQFQQDTTPLEDLAARNRDLINAPSPGRETATSFGGVAGDIREARIELRSDILDASGEFAGSDAGRAALVTAAAVEPTPVGEALLFGGGAAAIAGGAAASGTTEGASEVPTSPLTNQPELQIPEDSGLTSGGELNVPEGGTPVVDSELGVPDAGGINQPEISLPESPQFDSSEIQVPDRSQDDLLTVRATQLFREGRLRERGRGVSEQFRERQGASQDELQDILSGGGTLGEVNESPELDYRGENFGLREQPFGTDESPAVEQPEVDVTQTPSLDINQSQAQLQSQVSASGLDQPPRVEQTPDLSIQQGQGVDVGLDLSPSMAQNLSLTPSTSTTPVETGANVDLDVTETEPTEFGLGFGTPSGRKRRRPRLDIDFETNVGDGTFSFGGAEEQASFGVADLGFGDDGNDESPFNF